MNIFFGVLYKQKYLPQEDILASVLNHLKLKYQSEREVIWKDHHVGMGMVMMDKGSKLGSEQICFLEEDLGMSLLVDARIDYRDYLLRELGESLEFSQNLSDSQLILKAYQEWGTECVKHLYGDFSFAIWDCVKKKLFCARDHFGIRPFYYSECSDCFVFSSEISSIPLLTGKPFSSDDQMISDCIMGFPSDKQSTLYKGVNKLLPAHYLVKSEGSKTKLHRYWSLKQTEELDYISEADAISGLKDKLIRAIEHRIPPGTKVGCELSGGLDSSGLTSIAADICHRSQEQLYVYTHSLSEEQKAHFFPYRDEQEYSKLLIKSIAIRSHYVITGDQIGILPALYQLLINSSLPLYQSYPLVSDQVYEKALNHGVTVLLSGFGGDEGISYKAAQYLEEMLIHLKWKDFRTFLQSEDIKSKNISIIKYFIKKYLPIFPALFRAWKVLNKPVIKRYRQLPLKNSLRRKYKTKRRFNSDPIFKHYKNICERQSVLLNHKHIQTRLEQTVSFARIFGIEYCYPFLDVKLLEYYFSLPSKYKYNKGLDRYAYRQVLSDVVPDKIRLRLDKSGATVPSVISRLSLNESDYMSIIDEAEQNNTFHYIDYKRLKKMYKEITCKTRGRRIFAPMNFFNSISILILQKWQREGKIDIGIKC